jgi:tRNA-specific 2-thiouridylase
MKKTVVVGMSGGVDSSVAAYLLKEQGYHVIGLFMKNWDDDPNCPAEADYQDVVGVCEKLDIPFYSVNFVKEYHDFVFKVFLDELKLGYTPNPDILCNREIKFHHFFEKAKSLGADYLATGHYAKVDAEGHLKKCHDSNKDQTYFLHAVKQSVFKHVLFPLSDLSKQEVREIAKKIGLHNHCKKDSTGICFIGKRDFKTFIGNYLKSYPGYFKTLDGSLVKPHDGFFFYTIGQRKGLDIGGPGEAWFVVDKDPKTNTVYVAQGENHPSLFGTRLLAKETTWVSDDFKLTTLPYRCTAKIRYRQEEQPCQIVAQLPNNELIVEFDEPQRAITPRQSIVFYQEDHCLGGAMIEKKF